MKTLEILYNEVLKSEALKREFAQAMQAKDLEGFLRRNQCEASVAETEAFLQAQQTKQDTLSDQELDSVSGGGLCDAYVHESERNILTRPRYCLS